MQSTQKSQIWKKGGKAKGMKSKKYMHLLKKNVSCETKILHGWSSFEIRDLERKINFRISFMIDIWWQFYLWYFLGFTIFLVVGSVV